MYKLNTVSWYVDIPDSGDYEIVLNYSRPNEYPDNMGVINIEKSNGELAEMRFIVNNTGDSSKTEDWSQYIDDYTYYTVDLPSGTTRVSLNLLEISEDNTWWFYRPENGSLTLASQGTVEWV
jgi:hypothetical protein